MMGKISQGADFAGAVNYVLNRKEAQILATKGLRQGSNESMAESFNIQAQMNSIAKPVAHISLNFLKEDAAQLSDKKMVEIAVQYLEKMGYGNTQFLLVRHTDREHPHCHIIINRVDFEGKRISDKNEKRRNAKICRELTEKYGLHISEGKDDVKRHRLREPEKTKYEIYDSLKRNLVGCKSWNQLQGRLLNDGVDIEFKYNGSTDEVQGVKFTKKWSLFQWFKGR